jgi:FSR family fosmidomycin resistance protein-like MFS transporter
LPRLKLLLLLAFAHIVVDTVALVIQPLWPDLRAGLAMSDSQFQLAYVLWNVTTSLFQLPIGYWADRHHARWLIWAGPAVGVACIGCVGFVDSFAVLCVLLIVGGFGIAAFHPEAAALAASCAPDNRSRALSIFAIGGYVGQALGPLYAGNLTAAYGMPAIVWTMAWGWAVLVAVGFGLRRAPMPAVVNLPTAHCNGSLRGRGPVASLLVVVGILRVAPVLGMPLTLAFATKEAGGTNADVGFAQAIFMAAIGAGSAACALFVGRNNERSLFWTLPLATAALLIVCPLVSPKLLLACVGTAAFTLGVTLPVLVSYGQQILPGAQRIANGLTMGVTWAVASPIAAGAVEWSERIEQPTGAFYAFAGIIVASSVLCIWLPDSNDETAPQSPPARNTSV